MHTEVGYAVTAFVARERATRKLAERNEELRQAVQTMMQNVSVTNEDRQVYFDVTAKALLESDAR